MSVELSLTDGNLRFPNPSGKLFSATNCTKVTQGHPVQDTYVGNLEADASDSWPEFLSARDRAASGIFSRVKVTESGCWEWQGCRNERGYGQLRLAGRKIAAHRAMYILVNGDLPAGLHVTHSCDNPPCVNPFHLVAGTPADNLRDSDVKGRRVARGFSANQGEAHGRSKLTGEKVIEIRKLRSSGISYEAIARQYGVDSRHVSKICMGIRWKHIPLDQEPARG